MEDFQDKPELLDYSITRALCESDEGTDQTRDDAYRKVLKNMGFVTRDP